MQGPLCPADSLKGGNTCAAQQNYPQQRHTVAVQCSAVQSHLGPSSGAARLLSSIGPAGSGAVQCSCAVQCSMLLQCSGAVLQYCSAVQCSMLVQCCSAVQ
jgi:hypothetical protein